VVKLFFANAHSVTNNLKLEELRIYANELKLDIIGIAESWLSGDIGDEECKLQGYTLCRKDREEVKAGKGGVIIIYIKDNLTSCACTELNKYQTESYWVKIITEGQQELIVGVCYKSPYANDWEVKQLYSAIKEAASS
jgi:hypothetical protein